MGNEQLCYMVVEPAVLVVSNNNNFLVTLSMSYLVVMVVVPIIVVAVVSFGTIKIWVMMQRRLVLSNVLDMISVIQS